MASHLHLVTQKQRYAGVFCILIFMLTEHCKFADGAQGLFVFGDSYSDTGENMGYPYGMTWPRDGTAHRSSDGRNQVDYIAAKFGVVSPTPWEYLDKQGNPNNGGANFAVGGAGVLNAYGYRTLEHQVDVFQAIVKSGTWMTTHLEQSVALVAIGVNDYTSYNKLGIGLGGAGVLVEIVVDKIVVAIQRLQRLGITNIMVTNMVPMSCMPFATIEVNNETACTIDYLLDTETNAHNAKLHAKVEELNNRGANIIILDLTKAMRAVFENGPKYGFTKAYERCCPGDCDGTDVCADPSLHVIFDSIHPTDAGWKAVTDLYSSAEGYTTGPTGTLDSWIKKSNL